jgi:hypothetical protein
MAILRSEFPATSLTPAIDLRHELSRLHTVINRNTPERARQIENAVATLSGTALVAPVDAVTPSTLPAYQIFPELYAFREAYEKAVKFATAHSGTAVLAAILAQINFLLTEQLWTV